MDFAQVWSSGLIRSTKTAALVSGAPSSEIKVERALREVEVGLWEGLSADEAKDRFPEEWTARESDLVGFRFPAGESFRELQKRVTEGFAAVIEDALANQAPVVLVVAHKNVNRAILCDVLGLPLERMFTIPQEYCSTSVLRVRRRRRALLIDVDEQFDTP